VNLLTQPERILDRIPSKPDPRRMANYDVADVIVDLEPRSYSWAVPFHLDQQREGACVGHGWTHEGVARPVPVNFTTHALPSWAPRALALQAQRATLKEIAQAFAFEHYYQDRRIDEWVGENYDGTSVAAGAKSSAGAGLLGDGEYRWAKNVWDLAVAVSRKGPAVGGLDWWTGMFRPDSAGFLHLTGKKEGGHAPLISGFSLNATVNGRRWKGRKAFRIHNSWGEDWGIRGDAWIDYDDMGSLFEAQGEAAIPLLRLA
jgi:hypothetical protein